MRIAALSDIHANWHAPQAVEEELETGRPDAVYWLGDLVGYGAFPNEVVEVLRGRDWPTVMGNYDEGVGFDLDDCGCAYPTFAEQAQGAISRVWSQRTTREENKEYLRRLPFQIRREDVRPRRLLVHGSPRKMNEYVYEHRPAATFERLAALAGTDILFFGHTHRPYVKQVGRTWFVNASSVGQPRDGDPRACYALVELGRVPRVQFRRVGYDVPAATQAIRDAGLPEAFAEILEQGRQVAAESVLR
jgi:putative phosphoesterase